MIDAVAHGASATKLLSHQWQIQGGKGGSNEPPLWLHLTLRNADDRLNGNPPPFLAIGLRKVLLWLTLECFRREFENRSIRLVGLVVCLKKTIEMGMIFPKMGVASKISRTLHSQECTTTLLEILDRHCT